MPQDKRSFKPWQLYGLLLCLGVAIAWITTKHLDRPFSALAQSNSSTSTAEPAASEQSGQSKQSEPIDAHQIYQLPAAVVHVVKVPASAQLSVVAADDLMPVAELAQRENAAYAINGGFFDPQNGKTTSHLTVQGQIAGDPADNERLTGNPDLTSYLDRILNRSEFRAYRCAASGTLHPKALTYDIALHSAPPLANCEIESAVGAGPALLPVDGSFTEAFTDYENGDPTQGALIRDALGGVQRNARSAIGLDAEGAIFLIMVEKRVDSAGDSAADLQRGAVETSQGMSLAELSEFARSLGITRLLNLDGGSSSSLYVGASQTNSQTGPQTYFGRLDPEGNPIKRPVKSVIIVQP
jgi:exopolysaccharide biosynthesis protein